MCSISQVKKIRHYSTSPTRSIESEEPIRLSKFSGGYEPNPDVPKKIESLDWPSPPYPAAVPELRSRSRSSSNRRLDSSNNRISRENSKDHTDSAENDKKYFNENTKITGNSISDQDSVKKANKVYRKIYDNQYDDYLLRFKRNKNDNDNGENDEQILMNDKLKRELDEMSKLENKSGIAKIIAKELKVTLK